MSSIHFDADIDLSKLEEAIKKSNKTVGEWAAEIEKAGAGIDKGMQTITKESEEAVRKQKLLIRSMEDEIKQLRIQLAGTFSVKGVEELDTKLGDAQHRLWEAQDELIRMQEASTEATGKQTSATSGLVSIIGKWTAGLFTVSTALGAAKAIMMSTEGTASKLEETVSLLKGGFQGLFRTIATGDWSNLIRNIKDTATATRELKRETSELEHILAGNAIKKAELYAGLESSRESAAASTDPREKAAYLQDAVDYQKALTQIEVGERQARLKINEDYYRQLTGHSKEHFDYLLTQIPTIAKNYESYFSQQEGWQERLNQLKERERQLGTWQRDAEGKAILIKSGLTEAEAQERKELERLIITLQDYKILQDDLSKKGEWDQYVLGIADMIKATGDGDRAIVRLTTQLTAASSEAADEIFNLNQQIEEQSKKLSNALIAGNAEEIRSISAKIIALQDELRMRERIMRQAIIATEQKQLGPIQQMTIPGMSVIPSVMPKVKQSAQKTWDQTYRELTGLAATSEKWAERERKKIEKNNKEQAEALRRELEIRQEIQLVVADTVTQLGQSLGLSEETMQVLNASMDAFLQIARGNVVGGAVTMLSGILSQIPGSTSKFESQINRINALLKEQARLIELSQRTGGEEQLMQGDIKLLEDQRAVLEARIRDDEKRLNNFWNRAFGPNPKLITDLIQARRELIDVNLELDEARQGMADFFAGGITQQNIADTIAQGFQEGKTSVNDFAEYMNEVLTDAVLNVFKKQILGESINALTEQISAALSDKVLSEQETNDITTQIAAIADANRQLWNNLTGSLDMGTTVSQPGLSGAIRRELTEETSQELAGLYRKMSDDGRQSRDYLKEAVDHLTHLEAIEKNTGDTVEELKKSNTKLDQVVSNTKPSYSGLGGA